MNNGDEVLKDERDKIVEKCVATNGVRAIRNEIAIQKMLLKKKAEAGKN